MMEVMADIDKLSEKDLPLSSNVDQVSIYHYVLNMEVDFNRRTMDAWLIVMLKVTDDFKALNVPLQSISLDCKDLKIESIWEIHDYPIEVVDHLCSSLPTDQYRQVTKEQFYKLYRLPHDTKLKTVLSYDTNKWSLNIKPSSLDGYGRHEWQSRCICIKYQTDPNGGSLTWTPDQNQK